MGSLAVLQEAYRRKDQQPPLSNELVREKVFALLLREGLFSFKVQMIDMESEEQKTMLSLKNKIGRWLTDGYVWGVQYHLQFFIGDILYSFTNNGQVRQTLQKLHTMQKLPHVEVKVLEFKVPYKEMEHLADSIYHRFWHMLDKVD